MKKVTEKRLDEKMVLIASACAKMFVGDVVEKGMQFFLFPSNLPTSNRYTHTHIYQTAREIATRNGVSSDEKIAPKYIQEAYFDMVENSDVLFNGTDIRL